MQGSYELHPACAALRPLPSGTYNALVDSIRERGQLEDILLYKGCVLDGRHRERACLSLGITPRYREVTDAIVRGEPWVFVAEKHQHLRSPLTPSQVAAFYAENTAQKAAEGKKLREQNLKRGDKAPETAPGAVSGKRNESAEKVAENLRESGLQVGRRTLTGAKKVYEESPQLHQMVSDGEIKVKTAEAALKLPEPVLSAAIKGGPDAVHSAVANARLSHSTKESKECELRNLGVHESIVALMLQFRVAKKEVSSLVKSAERMRLPCRDKSTTKETMLLQLQKTVRTLEFASKAFGSILATAESSAKSASTT